MNGLLLFNKPILWTSHDAVDFIRRYSGQRAVGHSGALDPMATGLLVLLLGSATKLSQELTALDKDYTGTITFGIQTDTHDLEGRLLSWNECGALKPEDVERVFSGLAGRQLQVPPRYSSVRRQGRRLYEWARRGVVVEPAGRQVTVDEFQLLKFSPPDAAFFVRCSKGTYVRTLADEAGRRLGCGGVLSSLVRTRVGPFHLKNAFTEEQIRNYTAGQIASLLNHDHLQRIG